MESNENETSASRHSSRALVVALAVALCGDALLHDAALGLNLAIFSALLLGVSLSFAHRDERRKMIFPAVGVIATTSIPVVRDSAMLRQCSGAALVAFFALLTFPRHRVAFFSSTPVRYFRAAVTAAIEVALGAAAFAADVRLPLRRGTKILAFGRGLLLAAPFVVLFGRLFAAADESYAAFLQRLFEVDVTEALRHLRTVIALFCLAAGVMFSVGRGVPFTPAVARQRLRVGAVEIVTLLCALDLLFATFVWVQADHFFGGAAHVQHTAALTLSQYARSGFFELVDVAAFVFLLLMAVDWSVSKEDARLLRIVRFLAALQSALTLLIIASALDRLRLYAANFGLSERRVLSAAFVVFIALALLWLTVTMLRGRREALMGGIVVAATAVLLALAAIDPDALIARTNVSLALKHRRTLDVVYLTSLSTDAVPQMLAVAPHVTGRGRTLIVDRLAELRRREAARDWRSWNASRWRARRLLDVANLHRSDLSTNVRERNKMLECAPLSSRVEQASSERISSMRSSTEAGM